MRCGLEPLLDAVAGDLTRLRELIAELPREEADALLLTAVLRIACLEAALALTEEP
jgi:hypothetical protein